MPYKRKKGGQRLLEMARKSRKAKESRVGGKRYVTPTKAKAKAKTTVTKRGGTTITYKPKPSPQLKPAPKKKAVKKATPKPVAKKAKKSDAQKLADYRKNPTKGMAPRNLRTPAQRAALKKRLKNQMSEAGGMSKLASGLTKDIGDAEFATDLAITAATLPMGGPVSRGALTGAKALGRAAKATGGALKTGAKATGRAAKAGAKATGQAAKKAAKATKRAARKARVGLKKADRKLLKAQGLSRQGGKVRKIKEPNPFGKNAAKGSKPKVKSGKKNPFAGSDKPKAKGKQLDEHVKARYRLNERKARKAKKAQRKAAEQDAHVKAYKGDKIKKGKRKADKARKDAVAANKRAAEKAKALRVEKGYAQQRIDAQKASRARNRRRRS